MTVCVYLKYASGFKMFWEYILKKLIKGYLRYKTIASQNTPSETQVKNFFVS